MVARRQLLIGRADLLDGDNRFSASHDNIHVRGYEEEGTTTTRFDMAVLNQIDRFQLAVDAVRRVPRLNRSGIDRRNPSRTPCAATGRKFATGSEISKTHLPRPRVIEAAPQARLRRYAQVE